MKLDLRPATDEDIRGFAPWRYDPPYDVYNIAMGPDEAVAYFLDPDVHCHALVHGGDVVGYCTFGHDARVPGGEYDGDALDVGLGIEPALTGSGNGERYVAAVVAHARKTFGHRRLRVTIASDNERALRVWSGAGFVEVDRFVSPRTVMGTNEFVIRELTCAADRLRRGPTHSPEVRQCRVRSPRAPSLLRS